jgi:C4-dicarboxylate transporter DctM subunit
MLTLALVALPIVLLVLGLPIFLILLTASAAVLLFVLDVPPAIIHQQMFGSIDKFALLAVPFFIFAGEIMGRGGVSQRLLDWVASMIGSMRGNLPLTAVGTATVFGAISGSTAATVAAVGSIMYKPLRDAGYSERFASGTLTSSGAIANIIPPSIAMILYGFATETSVVELFAAGIVPGLLLAGMFGVYIYVHAARAGIGGSDTVSFARFLAATRQGAWALGAPTIILGGIYSGIFSPTEAAGVACVYAIFVTMVIYRDVTFRELFDAAARSVYLTAQVFIIVAAAGVYSWLLTVTGAAQEAVDFIAGLEMSTWLVLLVINVFLLLIGAVLDTVSAILVLTPLLADIALALGVHPVHFGLIAVLNLTIGTFTPPFGFNIFVAQAVFRTPLNQLYSGLLPFIILAVAALMLITYVPALSLWILNFI